MLVMILDVTFHETYERDLLGNIPLKLNKTLYMSDRQAIPKSTD